jgi:hypothetical protein
MLHHVLANLLPASRENIPNTGCFPMPRAPGFSLETRDPLKLALSFLLSCALPTSQP